jgi:hypothetical protein
VTEDRVWTGKEESSSFDVRAVLRLSGKVVAVVVVEDTSPAAFDSDKGLGRVFDRPACGDACGSGSWGTVR